MPGRHRAHAVKGREGLVEVNSRDLPGKISAAGPAEVNPRLDLVALAMQGRSTARPACVSCSMPSRSPRAMHVAS